MAISKEMRRRINRQNAQLSTGPRTDAGKKISSTNSFKHGLRIETLALPDEDAAVLRDRLDEWNDFYRPATPGEAELIDLAVFASVQRRRCQRFQAAAVSDQVRSAADRWDQDREDQIGLLTSLLATDPAAAVRQLGRTGLGCTWLIGRWERLDALLGMEESMNVGDRDEAVRLQGLVPDPDGLGNSLDATLTHRVLLELHPELARCDRGAVEVDIRDVLLASMRPRAARPVDPHAWVEDHGRALAWMRGKIAEHLGVLRGRAAGLRVLEERELAEAGERALLLEGPSGANLLRYERMYELAFHRSYGALLLTTAQSRLYSLPLERRPDSLIMPRFPGFSQHWTRETRSRTGNLLCAAVSKGAQGGGRDGVPAGCAERSQ